MVLPGLPAHLSRSNVGDSSSWSKQIEPAGSLTLERAVYVLPECGASFTPTLTFKLFSEDPCDLWIVFAKASISGMFVLVQ